MKNASLKARLLGFLLFGGLMPVVVIAVFVFGYVQARLYARLRLQLSISAEDVRDQVDREVFERYRDLKSLADDPALAASPAAALAQFLRGTPKGGGAFSRRSYRCLQVLRWDGAALAELGDCETVDHPRPAGGAGAPFFKTRALASGLPVLEAFLPAAASGPNASILRATAELRSLSDMLVREKLPGGLDLDVVVYAPDRQILARKNGVVSAALADEFPVLAALDGTAAGSGSGSLAGGRPALAAVNTLGGLAPPLDALKWKVAVVQPLDDLSEQTASLLRQLGRGIAAAALIAILASLLCWALLFRGVMRSLDLLDEAARRVRGGDLTTAIEVDRLDELGRLALFLNELVKRLKSSLDQLAELATKDALTGLASRRTFDQKIVEELKRAQRYGHGLALAFLDVDRFKECNDAHGHAFGDAVLREVSGLALRGCRETDVVARYDGDEIALILPVATKGDAAAAMERIRRAVEECRVEGAAAAEVPKITVSIGVARYPDDAATEKTLVAFANEALHKAKRGGRNRVVRANDGT